MTKIKTRETYFTTLQKYSDKKTDLNHFHKTIYRILCKIRRVSSCDQIHVHASVRKNQLKQILENFHYWNALLFVGIGRFQS